MRNIIVAVTGYLLLGAAALLIFDRATGRRITNRIAAATGETQVRMTEAGNPMGAKSARAFFLIYMWLLWPLVLLGSLIGSGKKGDTVSGKKENGSRSQDTGTEPEKK